MACHCAGHRALRRPRNPFPVRPFLLLTTYIAYVAPRQTMPRPWQRGPSPAVAFRVCVKTTEGHAFRRAIKVLLMRPALAAEALTLRA